MRNPDPAPRTAHPLLARYLSELDGLLVGIDPLERIEVVQGVREHVEEALVGTEGGDSDVTAALWELGPAAVVAEEAYAGRPAPGYLLQSTARPPVTARSWLPVTVAVLETLTLLLVLLVVGSSVVISSGSSSSVSADGTTTTTATESSVDFSWVEVIAGLVVSVPFWAVLVLLVAVTALWSVREKAVLMLLPLAVATAAALLPRTGYALLGVDGVYVGGVAALLVCLVGGGVLLVVLVRRALRTRTAVPG